MAIIESLATLIARRRDCLEKAKLCEDKAAKLGSNDEKKRANKMKDAETHRARAAEWEKQIMEVRDAPPIVLKHDDKGDYIDLKTTRYVVCNNPECTALLEDAGIPEDRQVGPYRGKVVEKSGEKWYGAKCPHCNQRLGVASTSTTTIPWKGPDVVEEIAPRKPGRPPKNES